MKELLLKNPWIIFPPCWLAIVFLLNSELWFGPNKQLLQQSGTTIYLFELFCGIVGTLVVKRYMKYPDI